MWRRCGQGKSQLNQGSTVEKTLDKQKFAAWVRDCMQRIGQPQDKIAAQLGVSRVSLNYWSRGKVSRPSWNKVEALAKLAGVSVHLPTLGSPVEDRSEGVPSSTLDTRMEENQLERLSPAEHQIIQDLRNLSEAEVAHIRQYLAFLRFSHQQKSSNVLALRRTK